MTADEMALRDINSLRQIIDYTPGVNTSQGEGHRDAVVFRGVRSTADFYLDGNRDDVQYYRALYNVEQVEILRGPNALLFGRGGTGGVLNRVSKKAELADEFTRYNTSLNSFGGYQLQLDTNLAKGEDIAFRINAMAEHLENHRDFYDGDRLGVNPVVRFALSDDTSLDLSYEYADHERFIDRGIPTDDSGKPIEAFEDVVFGDPQNNFHELTAHVFRANLEHVFSDSIKGNFSAFYGDYDKLYSNFYASGFDQPSNVVTLDGYIDTTKRENLIISANLVGEFDTGSIGHTLIAGVESINTRSNQDRFNPVFDSTGNDKESFLVERPLNFTGLAGVNADGDAVTTAFTDLNDDTHVNLDVLSVYIQDEIELSDKLDIVIGARLDSFDIEVDSFAREGDDINGAVTFLDSRNRKDDEVSPRGGIIYKPQENISIYASYSESFLPRSGEQYANINGNNNQLDPDTFVNQELGFKWDLNTGISVTAAIFENEQSSPQVADDDPATLDVIDQQIDGFEMQFSGELTENWMMNVNYSQLDGEIIERSGATGRTPRELPETTFSLWTSYAVTPDFGIGLGVTYQDESYINNSNSASLPSYTRVDASAYYQVSESMRIQLNIENLFDELYFPNAHSTHQATVGAPINAALTLVGSL
jgi:catecholate siderophore receptor